MTIRWLLLTVACVFMLSVGQMLFKNAAARWIIDGWGWNTWRSFLSFPMLLALVLYAATTILWVFILKHLSLSVAYPVYALSFLLVPLLAYFVLGESLTPKMLFGAALIVAGIVVTTR
jgi:drug/metabolite transporter (DMT)-like permease